jgi:hypothetical protein
VAQQDCAGPHQRLVAGAVAEAVVHRLEVVEVADHDAEARLGPRRPLDLGMQLLVERQAVLEAGQSIRQGCLREAADQTVDAIAHCAQEPGRREENPGEREPRRGHRVERGGEHQHGQVRRGDERELHGSLARAEEVGGVEAEPDVEHLAREGRRVLRAPSAHGDEHGPDGHGGLERPRRGALGTQEEKQRDRRAADRDHHPRAAEVTRAVQQDDREQDQPLAGEDRGGNARGEPRGRLRRRCVDPGAPLVSREQGHPVHCRRLRAKT